MARFAASSLWPGQARLPLPRLILALFGAPLIVATIVSLVAFLIAGMSEQSGAGVMQVTTEAAIALSALALAFTWTFGLIGMAMLWALALHGRRAWALMGAGAGGLAGVLFAGFAMQASHGTVITAFAIAGWAIFMLIRWIARIGAPPSRQIEPSQIEPSPSEPSQTKPS